MSEKLISTIHMLCDYCPTKHESKKHGGWNIYEDEKIYLALDTYVSNINVYVKPPNSEKHLVLMRGSHGHNQVYHPGKWEDYILSLHAKAVEAKEKVLNERKINAAKEHNRKFGPVSDDLNSMF